MSLYDDYFSKSCEHRLVAVTRPCFLPLWRALATILPIDLRPNWLFGWQTCACESCMTHAASVDQRGYGFWHWTRSEPIENDAKGK